MDFKALMASVLDPKILALAGGYLSYQFLGRTKKGYQPYLYGAGGAAMGYGVGVFAQKFLAPPVTLAPAPQVEAPITKPLGFSDYIDLDGGGGVKKRLALPAPRVRKQEALNLEGNFAGSGGGEDELGTFASPFAEQLAQIENAEVEGEVE